MGEAPPWSPFVRKLFSLIRKGGKSGGIFQLVLCLINDFADYFHVL